jgi:hypothetical protein
MWSHLFSSVISDEVVELLVVYTFVKSALNGPPSSQGDWLPKVCTSPHPFFSILQKQRCL